MPLANSNLASPLRSFCVIIILAKFALMQVQVEIEFDQLVQLVKRLPAAQWTKLKQEVEVEAPNEKEREEFKQLLLKGPTFSKKQLDAVDKTRKAINAWRTK